MLRAEAAPGVGRWLPSLLLLSTALELMHFCKINTNVSKCCWDYGELASCSAECHRFLWDVVKYHPVLTGDTGKLSVESWV